MTAKWPTSGHSKVAQNWPEKSSNALKPEFCLYHLIDQKKGSNKCRALDFQYTLHTDLLGEKSVKTQKNKSAYLAPPNSTGSYYRLRNFIRKPHSVHAVTAFCNFKSVLVHSPDLSPLILVPCIGYIRSKISIRKPFHPVPPPSVGLNSRQQVDTKAVWAPSGTPSSLFFRCFFAAFQFFLRGRKFSKFPAAPQLHISE